MSRADDLVPLFLPPPSNELGFRQGTVVSFDLSTGENVVDVGGTQLVNVPLLSVVESVSLLPGTVVALLTWKSSWWIIGRVITANSPNFGEFCVFENNGAGACVSGNGINIFPDNPPADVARLFAQHFVDGRTWVELIPPRFSGTTADNRIVLEGASEFGTTPGSLFLITAGAMFANAQDGVTIDGHAGQGVFRASGPVFVEAQGSGQLVLLSGTTATLEAQGTVFVDAQNGGQLQLTAGDIISMAAQGTIFIDAQAGQIQLISSTNQCFIDHTTTASAANCFIATNGLIQRSTSSLRYKTNVEDLHVDPNRVLRLRSRTWQDRAELEAGADPDAVNWHVGFIAEELDELGLTEFVEYDDAGQPEGIAYDRLSAALIEVIKDQATRLSDIETRLAALDGRCAPQPRERGAEYTPKPRRRPTLTSAIPRSSAPRPPVCQVSESATPVRAADVSSTKSRRM